MWALLEAFQARRDVRLGFGMDVEAKACMSVFAGVVKDCKTLRVRMRDV
jgi:hypothetical protein